MENVKCEISKDGGTLTITVDLRKDLGLSASGKSQLIASTRGGARLADKPDVSINVSVYRKAKA